MHYVYVVDKKKNYDRVLYYPQVDFMAFFIFKQSTKSLDLELAQRSSI